MQTQGTTLIFLRNILMYKKHQQFHVTEDLHVIKHGHSRNLIIPYLITVTVIDQLSTVSRKTGKLKTIPIIRRYIRIPVLHII